MALQKAGRAKALVLTCIDPRYITIATEFLNNSRQLTDNYDLFILAGAELGSLSNTKWNKK